MKKCWICQEIKELSNFGKHNGRKDGLADACKLCRNKKIQRERYGINKQFYESLISKQNNKCAICERVETVKHQSGQTRDLSVDHCHITGKIRGLLCGNCNNGLGRFEDSINFLKKAIQYLEENK